MKKHLFYLMLGLLCSISAISCYADLYTAQNSFQIAENDSVWQDTKDVAGDTWEGTKNVTSDVWDGTKKVTSDVWDGAKNVADDVKDGITGNNNSENHSDNEHTQTEQMNSNN